MRCGAQAEVMELIRRMTERRAGRRWISREPPARRARILRAAALLCLTAACTRAPEPAAQPPFTEISLHRSACYGSCPVYTVSVLGDGTVLYAGEEHVEVEGGQRALLAAADLSLLAGAFECAAFMFMKDRYFTTEDGCQAMATDGPSIGLRFKSAAGEKEVWYDTGCWRLPEGRTIRWLAETVDLVANTQRWTGVR